jgi:ABC-type sugar transport system substrate-binding protein
MGLTVAAGSAFAAGRKAAAPKKAGEIKSIGVSLYYQRDEWYVGV